MNLSKEQIAEIAEKIWKEIDIGDFDKKEYFEKWLTEKFGQQPGAREESWPALNETFYVISANAVAQPVSCFLQDQIEQYREIGNCYRTKEEAEECVSQMKRAVTHGINISALIKNGIDEFLARDNDNIL